MCTRTVSLPVVDPSVDAAEGGLDLPSSLVERLGPVPSHLLPHRGEVLVLRLYLRRFWSWAAHRLLPGRLPAPTVMDSSCLPACGRLWTTGVAECRCFQCPGLQYAPCWVAPTVLAAAPYPERRRLLPTPSDAGSTLPRETPAAPYPERLRVPDL